MSVINRMLSDLEGRGARSPEQGPPAPAPGASPGRRRAPWAYAAPIALALALVAVAAALLYQRWPAIAAVWPSQDIVAPLASEEAPADEPSTNATPSRPALASLAFAPVDGGVELRLETSAPPEAPPAYERDGTAVRLQLPLAGAAGAALPAPPADQEVVRELRLETAGQRPTLHLRVASDARIGVARGGSGYVVTARAGTAPDAADGETRDSDDRAAGDEPAVTETDGNAAPDDGDDGDNPDSQPPAAEEDGRTAEQDSARSAETASTAGGDDGAGAGAQAGDGSDSASTAEADAATASVDEEQEGRAADAETDPEAATAASRDDANAGGDDEAVVRADGQTEASVRAQRRYRSARQALDNGDLAQARTELRAAVQADPDLHPARDLLVTLLRRVGASEAARDVLAKGLERAPERRAYAEPMARLLVEAGELERAAEILERAAPAGGGEPSYHALRGAVAQRLDRHDQAINAYTRALEGDTSRGPWWLGLAISLAAADHPKEARSAFREARATGDLSDRLDRWAQQRIEALASSAGE